MVPIFIISLMLIMMVNPISFILTIILQIIWTAFILATVQTTPWMSYILVMIFVGAMLIIFSYMASLAANEKFSKNMTVPKLLMSLNIFMMMLLVIPTSMKTQPKLSMSYQMKTLFLQNSMVMLILMSYLLFVMVIISKISITTKGPLRSYKYYKTNPKTSSTT